MPLPLEANTKMEIKFLDLCTIKHGDEKSNFQLIPLLAGKHHLNSSPLGNHREPDKITLFLEVHKVFQGVPMSHKSRRHSNLEMVDTVHCW